MQANDAKLVVRMPQAEKRRIKSLAAHEGLTLRQAIEQAFKVWESQLAAGHANPRPAQPSGRAADSAKPDPAKASSGPDASSPSRQSETLCAREQCPD